jgi:hypothetical protein
MQQLHFNRGIVLYARPVPRSVSELVSEAGDSLGTPLQVATQSNDSDDVTVEETTAK